MMTSPNLVFVVAYLLFGEMAETNHFVLSHQDTGFMSANVGDDVTLSCLISKDDYKQYWYKQTLGQKPQLISGASGQTHTFYNELRQNPRFSLQTDPDWNHLKISNVQLSDSATYFCVSSLSGWFEFKEVITVSVEGPVLNLHPLVHQSESQSLQPGDSVTLNCTVHPGPCAGEEHSVYWLKNPQEPHHGTIYTTGDRSDQCERKANNQTHSCVYKLPLKSVNLSHAGTYYCAVATCGHILFGNGTKVDVEVAGQVSTYFMTGALTFTTFLSVLAFSMCIFNTAINSSSADSHETLSRSSETPKTAKTHQNEDAPRRRERETDDTWTECVYSGVTQ